MNNKNWMLVFIFLILILIFSCEFFAQQEKYKISGKLNLLAGFELIPPNNIPVELSPLKKIVLSDSLGNFEFDNLLNGEYKVIVAGVGFERLDTLVMVNDQSINDLNILLFADCEVTKELAENHIANGKPRLLLSSGIAPVIYKGQKKFEQKYNINYYEYGCISPTDECMQQYNGRIFRYLDEVYGSNWRVEVRQDVVGLKQYLGNSDCSK